MCKKYMLGSLMILMILLGAVCYHHEQSNGLVLTVREDDVPRLTVSTQQSDNTIEIWQDETSGRDFFFLPSCVTRRKVVVGNIGTDSLRIDGKLLEKGDAFTWEEGRAYELQITDEAYETHTYNIAFMKSANIPAVFINTASGSMAYLEEDKENEEPGDICVVHEDGNTEYQGKLERISGRGNSTWKGYDKKPYAFKLSEKYPLCGLDRGNRWRLLALCREGSKLDNKLAMDLAEELGLAYSVQGTWVDLYLNGQYAGNYLLTESVTVGEGRVDITDLEKENEKYNRNIDNAERYEGENNKGYVLDNGGNITGGYLIEKDQEGRYAMQASGFVTSLGHPFTINSPSHASGEQVQYIRDHVENIEKLAQEGRPEVWDYLDADSFAGRFLVDEISLNTDAGYASMYFYKERDDDKLYSGPAWDYDNSFGERNSYGEPGYDYEYTVLDGDINLPNCLDWYKELYDMPEMQERIKEKYKAVLPFFEDVLGRRIDEYAEAIRASVMMDEARWGYLADGVAGVNADYDANVRYMKSFIAKRLNWLCGRWGVEHEAFQVPSDGQLHRITFVNDEGVVDTMQVLDGAEIAEVPAYDGDVYQGWVYQRSQARYRRQISVYEDTVFYNFRVE